MLGYLGWLIPHAHEELTERYAIDGLHRRFASPYPLPNGEGIVLDPRTDALHTELGRRCGVALGPLPAHGAPPEQWLRALQTAGLDPQPTPSYAPLPEPPLPRLMWLPEGPRLLLGHRDHLWFAYDPHHGLLWTHERARADAPAWDLAACPRGWLP